MTNSYAEELARSLKVLREKFRIFICHATVHEFRIDPHSEFVIVAPPYFYSKPLEEDQQIRQLELLKLYNEWMEHFSLLTLDVPTETKKKINDINKELRKGIDLEGGWGISRNVESNFKLIADEIDSIEGILSLFSGASTVTLIPDTNSLILDPDFASYKAIAGEDVKIIINSTVLAELDNLKVVRRDDKFRDKVESVINRIKGLRKQGSLIDGVIVDKTIIVAMAAKEPDFKKTLTWLDPTNNDDRIIAFVIEYMRTNPGEKVILVTADINLQNKSEMAKIPYSEPPSKL